MSVFIYTLFINRPKLPVAWGFLYAFYFRKMYIYE